MIPKTTSDCLKVHELFKSIYLEFTVIHKQDLVRSTV